jgi:soluble cytochrome b562
MTILSKLKLTEKTKADVHTSPELRARQKLILAIDNQIAAAKSEITGEPHNLRAMRWIEDPETGERVRREVPIKVRRWWWRDEAGAVMLDIRYGNRRMHIAPNKPTIQASSMDQLVPTLEQVREAVAAGELDKAIAASSVRRKTAKN